MNRPPAAKLCGQWRGTSGTAVGCLGSSRTETLGRGSAGALRFGAGPARSACAWAAGTGAAGGRAELLRPYFRKAGRTHTGRSRLPRLAAVAAWLLLALAARGETPADPALRLWYDFAAVTGATIRDVSGAGHDATLEGKDGQLPQIVPTPYGQALRLDKDKRHGLRVTTAPDLVGTDGLTVMAWVRPDTTRGHLAVLANKGDRVPDKPATGYRLSVFYNAIFAELGFGDADGVRLTTPEWSLAAGYWAHLTMAFDGQTLTLYINATEAARLRLSEPRRLAPGPKTFTIGKYYWNDAYPFTGLLADVRIYTRALSAAEVLAAACEALNRGRQRTSTPRRE